MFKNSFYQKLDIENKYIIKCCFFIFFVNGIYSMVFGSILPLLSNAYQLDDTVSGILLSGHQAGNLIAGLVAGILPIYLGRKKSILFLSSFVAIGFLMIALTGNPLLLVVAFFLTGISRGSISNFNNKVVNDISNSSPSALNFLHSVFAVGALIAPFIVMFSTSLFNENGWRVTCFVIVALILVAQFMFSRMTIKEEVLDNRSDKKGKSYIFFKDIRFLTAVFILFFYLCAESSINGWIVKYFVDANILNIWQSQVLSSVLWIGVLIGRLACVFFGHKLKRGHLLLLISTGMTICYFLLLSAREYSAIMIIILSLGISMGGIYPTAMTIAGDSIKDYPMAMGWLLVIGGIGGILMPVITGVLSTHFGIFSGMAAIVIAIILMLLGVAYYVFAVSKKVFIVNSK